MAVTYARDYAEAVLMGSDLWGCRERSLCGIRRESTGEGGKVSEPQVSFTERRECRYSNTSAGC